MASVVAIQVNDILSVIHAKSRQSHYENQIPFLLVVDRCILLTIIGMFCRIVDASNYSTFHFG